jgi:hypothetical protein
MKVCLVHFHKPLAVLILGLVLALPAQAALHNRGGGMLYDDVLNVTWLQDANYAKTSGYDADGQMTWAEAKTWADGLVFHDSVRNVNYNDWRLASNSPVGADWSYNYSPGGTTDVGYNITSEHSELSYMYYVNLGLKGALSPTEVSQSNFGVHGNGTYGGQRDVGLVQNLQSSVFWSGTAYAPNPTNFAWRFGTNYGFQYYDLQDGEFFAWAVRPGDVAAPVPEPEAYAMLLAGFGVLGFVARWRRVLGASQRK